MKVLSLTFLCLCGFAFADVTEDRLAAFLPESTTLVPRQDVTLPSGVQRLKSQHPSSGVLLEFYSPNPRDYERVLRKDGVTLQLREVSQRFSCYDQYSDDCREFVFLSLQTQGGERFVLTFSIKTNGRVHTLNVGHIQSWYNVTVPAPVEVQ